MMKRRDFIMLLGGRGSRHWTLPNFMGLHGAPNG
jgi:hypothetical protein